VNKIIENLKGLGTKRLVSLGVAGAAIFAVVLIAAFSMRPSYRAIVTDVSAAEASRMLSTLEQGGFSPKISEDGTVISVAENDLARARMSLAEGGHASSGPSGWELFDTGSGIGRTSFDQRIARLRALQGELERSIHFMESVDTARVHIVLPDRETYSQESPVPTASVMIQPKRGMQFDRNQALAVRSLVSGAVPKLRPENVEIADTSGNIILGKDDANTSGGLASKRAEIEENYARSLERLLLPVVGAGNVRVRVAAELATSREVIVRQTFDPDQQVARQTSALAENSQGRDQGAGTVDVANNMPGIDAGAGANGGREEMKSKTLDETSYEIGNTRSETVTESGGIKRLSVAIIVNGVTTDGTYTDRTPEEIARISALAESSVGIDKQRGDVVTVESMRFIDAGDMLASASGGGLWDLLSRNSGTIIRGLLGLAAIGMIIFFVIRPIIGRNAPETNASANPAAVASAPSDEPDIPASMEDPADEGISKPDDENEAYVSIGNVQGNVMRRYIDELDGMISDNQEESIRVLRSWIHQKS